MGTRGFRPALHCFQSSGELYAPLCGFGIFLVKFTIGILWVFFSSSPVKSYVIFIWKLLIFLVWQNTSFTIFTPLLSVFTRLWNLCPDPLHLAELKLYTGDTTASLTLLQFLWPPFSFSMGLSTLETTSRAIACLFMTGLMHLCPWGRHGSPPLCVYHVVCLSSISRHLCFLHLLATVCNSPLSTGLQIYFQDTAFMFKGDIYSEVGLLSRMNPSFNFLRSCPSVFHSSGTILIFHQQCPKIPTSSHPCQHLLCFLLVFISFCFY